MARRIMTHATLLAVVVGTLVVVTASPAVAAGPISGWELVKAISPTNSSAHRNAIATCPQGKVVLGGGGNLVAIDDSMATRLVFETLLPMDVTDANGELRDAYVAGGGEVEPGIATDWYVEAFAICAHRPSGYARVQSTFQPASSGQVKNRSATCGGEKKATGSGAYTSGTASGPFAEVGIQRAIVSTTGGGARAQAHTDVDGFAGAWNLHAVAICADPRSGYEIFTIEFPAPTHDRKLMGPSCRSNRKLMTGAGASLISTAPAHATLLRIEFGRTGTHAEIEAVENTPYEGDWGPLTGQVICASPLEVD